jgi:hypothetical protein
MRAVLPSASARPAESSASSARISSCCGARSSATRMPSSCSSAHPPDASSVSETATSTSMLWVRTTLRSSGRTISAHSSASDGASAAALPAHPADSKKHRISTKRRTLRSDRDQGLLRHTAGPLSFSVVSVSEPACIPPCGCAAPPSTENPTRMHNSGSEGVGTHGSLSGITFRDQYLMSDCHATSNKFLSSTSWSKCLCKATSCLYSQQLL